MMFIALAGIVCLTEEIPVGIKSWTIFSNILARDREDKSAAIVMVDICEFHIIFFEIEAELIEVGKGRCQI